MKHKTTIVHTPLNSRFMPVLLLVSFALIIVSAFGITGSLAFFSPEIWLCVFVTAITGTFFIAGIASIVGGFLFLWKFPSMERTDGAVAGWQKEKRSGRSGSRTVTIYYPKISYRFHGEERMHISSIGSHPPKYKEGDTVLLYVDAQTGAAAEKGDAVSCLAVGALAAIFGGALTAAVWIAYFKGWITP